MRFRVVTVNFFLFEVFIEKQPNEKNMQSMLKDFPKNIVRIAFPQKFLIIEIKFYFFFMTKYMYCSIYIKLYLQM